MKTTLLDAAGYWVAERLQRFGVKRAFVALLIGLGVVGGVAAVAVFYGLVKAVVAISAR